MNMKLRYRLFLRRKSVYYAFDDTTKTFTSLRTRDKTEASVVRYSSPCPLCGSF